MNKAYYHGSSTADIRTLEPRSTLHGTADKVVYLTDHLPYALLYIWDQQHTEHTGKYVTAWIRDGVAYYEEQFPHQLQTFYQGVQGYLYSMVVNPSVQPVAEREAMYYTRETINVAETTLIPDVYDELLKHEAQGTFRVLRYVEQTAQRQEELISMIAEAIRRSDFFCGNEEEIVFMKKHFPQSWERATAVK